MQSKKKNMNHKQKNLKYNKNNNHEYASENNYPKFF